MHQNDCNDNYYFLDFAATLPDDGFEYALPPLACHTFSNSFSRISAPRFLVNPVSALKKRVYATI